jgi:hypothetical protein
MHMSMITGEGGRLSYPAWTGGRDFGFLPEESEPSSDDVRLQLRSWGVPVDNLGPKLLAHSPFVRQIFCRSIHANKCDVFLPSGCALYCNST